MCDYSLEGYATRKAEVGDQLIISRYAHGFVTTEINQEVSKGRATICLTCLQPGTRLNLVILGRYFPNMVFVQRRTSGNRDYIDLLSDGMTAVCNLPRGTTATVLSIPGVDNTTKGVQAVERALDEQDRTRPTMMIDAVPVK